MFPVPTASVAVTSVVATSISVFVVVALTVVSVLRKPKLPDRSTKPGMLSVRLPVTS